jgi:predicted HTH domain antitoxin
MSNAEIKALYDSDLSMTLTRLSRLTGKSINELKRILMEG